MADREVRQTGKDADGDIVTLCNDSAFWSPIPVAAAIKEIANGIHYYFVPLADGGRVPIDVVSGPTGPYLRTRSDRTETNNLDELPDGPTIEGSSNMPKMITVSAKKVEASRAKLEALFEEYPHLKEAEEDMKRLTEEEVKRRDAEYAERSGSQREEN